MVGLNGWTRWWLALLDMRAIITLSTVQNWQLSDLCPWRSPTQNCVRVFSCATFAFANAVTAHARTHAYATVAPAPAAAAGSARRSTATIESTDDCMDQSQCAVALSASAQQRSSAHAQATLVGQSANASLVTVHNEQCDAHTQLRCAHSVHAQLRLSRATVRRGQSALRCIALGPSDACAPQHTCEVKLCSSLAFIARIINTAE